VFQSFLVPFSKTENQGFLHTSANLNFISWKILQSALEGYYALQKDSTRYEYHEILD
jgi:hypothetical protein